MSLASIVETFVQSCSGVEAPAESTANSSMSEKPSADEYMFDPSKDVAQQTMRNLGWDVGVTIALKSGPPNKEPQADSQYTISYINDDGSVAVCKLSAEGNKNTEKIDVIQQKDLSKLYKVVDKAHILAKDKEYHNKFDFGEGFFEATAVIGINAAFGNNLRGAAEADLYKQKEPSEKLIVDKKEGFKAGELAFVAWPQE